MSEQERTDHDPPLPARSRFGLGAAVVVVIAALAVTVAIGIFRGQSAPSEPVVLSHTPGAAGPSPKALYVHVAGAVRDPGLYMLDPGARLMDAVSAAGGFEDDAAREGVNLARPVQDGEQIVVPAEGEEASGPAAEGLAGATAGGGKVNLNTADEQALEALPRIGPALAGRILRWREEHGSFTSVEDLQAVSGIGEKMIQTLRDLVTV